MSAHTAGPWVARESNTYTRDRFVIRPAHPAQGSTLGFKPICTIEGDARLVDAGTREANAHLIAAAPELLQACMSALDHLVDAEGDCLTSDGAIADVIAAAINKATGGQP